MTAEPDALNGYRRDGLLRLLEAVFAPPKRKKTAPPGICPRCGIRPKTGLAYCDECRRAVNRDGDPWFVAKDVCDVLDIANSRDALSALDEDEKSNVGNTDIRNAPNRGLTVINESGLYSLILRSRKPEARAFRKWVTAEVLPSIRKTGGYVHASENMSDDEIMARALLVAQSAIERKDAQLREQREQLLSQAPDVEYCRDVLAAANLHTVNSIAVHLGISAIRLNKFLVERGYIYKQGDIYCPSCKIRDKGYCDFQVVPYLNSQGEKMTREHLKWTESGRRFVIEEYRNRNRPAPAAAPDDPGRVMTGSCGISLENKK